LVEVYTRSEATSISVDCVAAATSEATSASTYAADSIANEETQEMVFYLVAEDDLALGQTFSVLELDQVNLHEMFSAFESLSASHNAVYQPLLTTLPGDSSVFQTVSSQPVLEQTFESPACETITDG